MKKISSNHTKRKSYMYDIDNILSKIEAVEPSPYLFSRINNALYGVRLTHVSSRIVWSAAAAIVVLFIVNGMAIFNTMPSNNPTLADQFGLLPDNSLYK